MRGRMTVGYWILSFASLIGCGGLPSEDVASTSAALSTVSVLANVQGYTRSDGIHAIVFRSVSTGHPTELAENPFGGGVLTDMGGASSSCPLWGYKRSDNVNAVVYLDNMGHVHELSKLGSGSWGDVDFTAASVINAPLGPSTANGATSCEIIGYVRTDGVNAMVYRGANNHIIEITSNFPNSPPWLVNDLTVVVGGPAVGLDGPVPYIRSDSRNTLIYVASDNHVHELASNFPSFPPWIDSDLFAASGETVLPATGAVGYVRSDGIDAVVFVGRDLPNFRVHELSLHIGSSCGAHPWCANVIPGGANASGLSRPSAYVRADGLNAVVYNTHTSDDLHELTLPVGGNWSDGVLPVPPGSSPLTRQPFGHRAPGNRSSVLFIKEELASPFDNNGVELSLPAGGPAWQSQVF